MIIRGGDDRTRDVIGGRCMFEETLECVCVCVPHNMFMHAQMDVPRRPIGCIDVYMCVLAV